MLSMHLAAIGVMATAIFGHGPVLASLADAEYRKDVFLPFDEYEEPVAAPLDGGRVFVVGKAAASGPAQSAYVNGKLVNLTLGQNSSTWDIDFLHVLPQPLVEGEPFFAVFHSRQSVWDTIDYGTLRITDPSSNELVNVTFPVKKQRLLARVTYLTTANNGTQVLVHVASYASTTLTNPKLTINGVPAKPASPTRPFPSTVPPGESVMFVAQAPNASGVPVGAVLTARVQLDDGGVVAVAGIRRQPEFFPVEAWPKSHECPYPTVNDTNYRIHRKSGVNTFFTTDGSTVKCENQLSEVDIINRLAPRHDFWVLGGKDINTSHIKDTSRLAGWFLGDEDDNHANVTDQLREVAAASSSLWSAFPGVPTYVGGSRNRRRGVWANTVDALGMDFYTFACAPHVTNWGGPFHLRGSYDYLFTTRQNHMPWPTWTYSQAFDSSWNADILGTVVVRQPDPAEMAIAMQSVVAAGAKGLMLFQTEIALNASVPESWAELAVQARQIGAAAELYRQGDLAGPVATTSSNETIAALIQSPRALLLTLISLANDGGYDDLSCAVGGNDHWKLVEQDIAINFTVPVGWQEDKVQAKQQQPFVDIFELANAAVTEASCTWQVVQKDLQWQVTCPSQTLTPERPTRTIIFAQDSELRSELEESLKPWTPRNP